MKTNKVKHLQTLEETSVYIRVHRRLENNVVNGAIHMKPQKYSVRYARYKGLKPCRKGCTIGSF